MLQFGSLDISAKYRTAFLVEKLVENYETHKADYTKALVVYRSDIEKALKVLADEVAKARDVPTFEPHRDTYITTAHNVLVRITKPTDAAKNYEQYISLFKQSVSEELELTMSEANSIINDEWDWAVSAKLLNSTYSSRY